MRKNLASLVAGTIATSLAGCTTYNGFEAENIPREKYVTNAMDKVKRDVFSNDSINMTTGIVRASYRNSENELVQKAFIPVPLEEGEFTLSYLEGTRTDLETGEEIKSYRELTPSETRDLVLVDFENATQVFNKYDKIGNVDMKDGEVLVLIRSPMERVRSDITSTWNLNEHGGWAVPPKYKALIQTVGPETEAMALYTGNGELGVVINPTMGPENSRGEWINQEKGIFQAPLTVGYAQDGGIYTAVPGKVERTAIKKLEEVPMFEDISLVPNEDGIMVPKDNKNKTFDAGYMMPLTDSLGRTIWTPTKSLK